MIKLTRLNGSEIIVNAELIEWIETIPDTTISLATGSKIIVKNKAQEVISKIMEYRKDIMSSKSLSPTATMLKDYQKDVR